VNGPLITTPGLDRPWRVAHLQLSRARVHIDVPGRTVTIERPGRS
jgi:hypothetical protein